MDLGHRKRGVDRFEAHEPDYRDISAQRLQELELFARLVAKERRPAACEPVLQVILAGHAAHVGRKQHPGAIVRHQSEDHGRMYRRPCLTARLVLRPETFAFERNGGEVEKFVAPPRAFVDQITRNAVFMSYQQLPQLWSAEARELRVGVCRDDRLCWRRNGVGMRGAHDPAASSQATS